MKAVPVTQFLHPDGKIRPQWCDVNDDVFKIYAAVIEPNGLRITAECLKDSPFVSLCLEHELGDFACVLAANSPTEPELVLNALEALIRRFDVSEFEFWRSQQE